MPISGRINVAVFFAILLGAAYLVLFDPPFIVRVFFVLLCISWAALCFFTVLRGRDEVVSARVRYALAFSSAVGVPVSAIFVLFMNAVPSVQNAITFLASSDRNELAPAAAGFGLGVAFVVLVLSASLLVGLAVWWASKR